MIKSGVKGKASKMQKGRVKAKRTKRDGYSQTGSNDAVSTADSKVL